MGTPAPLIERLLLPGRLLPDDVRHILEAEVHDKLLWAYRARVALGGIGVVVVLLNRAGNDPTVFVATLLLAAIYTLFAGGLLWLLSRRIYPTTMAWVGITIDITMVTLFSACSLWNYSGAYEALLAPALTMLYMLFNGLTALQFSVEASLYAAFFSAFQRFLLLHYIVQRGYVELSEVSRYDHPVITLADQYTLVFFIAMSGVIAAVVARVGRGILLHAARETVHRQRVLIERESIGRYVSPTVVDWVLSHPEAVGLGGMRRHATVMFVDIRNFTPLTAQEPPEVVVELLNGVFTGLVSVVFARRGTLDKFLGDGLMAYFGVHIALSDAPLQAVAAAMEMQAAIARYNQTLRPAHIAPLRIGIGVATGEVIAGNVGSPQRMEYTVIGATVNLASRLQELNRDLGSDIVIDRATAEAVGERLQARATPPQRIRGMSREEIVYIVEGLTP